MLESNFSKGVGLYNRKMIKDNQYFVFMDYETTGIDTSRITKDRPIQIGLVLTDSKFKKLLEYQRYIKWDSIMEILFDNKWPEEFQGAYKVHKIEPETIFVEGEYPYTIRQELNFHLKKYCNNRKPVIISDAPNFEMFWTEMIYGSRQSKSFPFHYNAWSIYPTFQLLDVNMDKKPHDALSDAKLLHKGMLEVSKKLKEFNNE